MDERLKTKIQNLINHLQGHAGHLLQSPFNINKQLDAAAPYNNIAWKLEQLLLDEDDEREKNLQEGRRILAENAKKNKKYGFMGFPIDTDDEELVLRFKDLHDRMHAEMRRRGMEK